MKTEKGDRVYYLGAAVDQGSHDYPPTKDELERPMTEETKVTLQDRVDDLESQLKAIKEFMKTIFDNKMTYSEVIESLKKEVAE
jgi:hypothetical protein